MESIPLLRNMSQTSSNIKVLCIFTGIIVRYAFDSSKGENYVFLYNIVYKIVRIALVVSREELIK